MTVAYRLAELPASVEWMQAPDGTYIVDPKHEQAFISSQTA